MDYDYYGDDMDYEDIREIEDFISEKRKYENAQVCIECVYRFECHRYQYCGDDTPAPLKSCLNPEIERQPIKYY